MIRAGIIGGAGYTGGELIRLLMYHPQAEIAFVHSRSQAGKPVSTVHEDLYGLTDLCFTETLDNTADVVFLCMGHGESAVFMQDNPMPDLVKIIDLSQDFRIAAAGNLFVYGLPESNRDAIKKSDRIANPGCFATAIQLAVLPLLKHGIFAEELHLSGVTGSTGAGQQPSATSHFSWRYGNISLYKAFKHQHLAEVGQTIHAYLPDWNGQVNFLPFRGPFTRGIIVAAYLKNDAGLTGIKQKYTDFYADHPFTDVVEKSPNVKQVVNTNRALLHLEKHGDTLLVTSVIDNLLKGASGQAVQNMNLMFGISETSGLNLKPVVF